MEIKPRALRNCITLSKHLAEIYKRIENLEDIATKPVKKRPGRPRKEDKKDAATA